MITYTFIIPHKNSPELLDRCLNSIPQREDIEIIVVDDNSTFDKSPNIYRSDCTLIKLSEKDSNGAGHARNVGLDKATGKWLLFADCDDYYEPNFIDFLDEYKCSDIDVLYFCAFLDTVEKPDNSFTNRYDDLLYQYEASEKQIKDIQRIALSSNEPWSKMYNHAFIKSIGSRFEEIPLSNDAWFVNYSGTQARKIAILKKRLYHYVITSSGITNRKRPFSHYIKAIKSNRKRNYLKAKCKCIDLVQFPGFNDKNIIRDFGKFTFYILILYKLLTDWTMWFCLYKLIKQKVYD